MRAVKLAVIGAAAAAGVGVVALVQSELDSARRQAAPAAPVEAPEAVAMTQILVAADELNRGRKLSTADFEWRDWPAEAVVAGFITNEAAPSAFNDYSGQLVRQKIVAGEPIMATKLIEVDSRGMMSTIVRKGMRGFAIKLVPEKGAGGFILPGDFVDVILTWNASVETTQPNGETTSKSYVLTDTLLRNVRVLAIDTISDSPEDSAVIEQERTGTLEVTAGMTEVLALGEELGRLTLALRSFGDSMTEDGELPSPEMVVDYDRLAQFRIGSLSREGVPLLGVGSVNNKTDDKHPETPEADHPTPNKRVMVVRGSVRTESPVE